MNFSQLTAIAVAATLLVPGTALAGKGNGKPNGKPETPAQGFSTRTLEGPVESPDAVETPTSETPTNETPTSETPESGAVVTTPRPAKKAKKNAARKAAKAACKRLSKKRVKGRKGTPYSRCIVAAAKRHKQQPVQETTPLEPAPIVVEPAPPVEEPVQTQPTEPAPTDPVEDPAV